MAEGIVTGLVDVARNANAQNIIFRQEKPTQMQEVTGSGGSAENSPPGSEGDTPTVGPNPPLRPKDFYWDQVVVILVSAILGLTLLDIAVEFFRGSGVFCYTPATDDFTRDRATYVNNFCSQSVSRSEYYPIFIVVHGLAIIAPHYLWSSFFGGYFDFFFDLVKDLNRLRNLKTGDYDPNNFEIVKKLEREYKQNNIFYSYILKLLAQLFFALLSFFVAIFFFDDFSPVFTCPSSISDADLNNTMDGWPLSTTVTCIYTSLRFLSVIRYVDYVLTALSIFAILFGLCWCFFRHTAELGHENIAKFVVGSCFLPEHYVPKSFWIYPCSPRIRDDLDFLLMKLFTTDPGHGQVFKEIQVQKEVESRTKQEHALLRLFGSSQKSTRTRDLRILFKEAGFKGNPRHDVYRRFSPRFGITKEPKECKKPLERKELQKVAEEVATSDRDLVVQLAKRLVGDDANELGGVERISELRKRMYELLQVWLDARNQNGREGTTEQPSLPMHSHGIPLSEVQAQNVSMQGQQPDSQIPSASVGRGQSSAASQCPPRKQLVHYLHEVGLKETGDGIYYGRFLRSPVRIDEFQNRLHGFVQFADDNKFALSISFGSVGCAYFLAWAFGKVVSVNFDPYLQDEESVVKIDTFFSNLTMLHCPPDISVQKTENVLKFQGAIQTLYYGHGETGVRRKQNNCPEYKTDFIVVGPINHRAYIATVTQLIEILRMDDLIHRGAILLAIHPLKIGDRYTVSQCDEGSEEDELNEDEVDEDEDQGKEAFAHYTPPPDLFKRTCVDDDNDHKKLLQQIGRENMATVGKMEGIPATCGDVSCVFEFSVYRYQPKKETEAKSKNQQQQNRPKEKIENTERERRMHEQGDQLPSATPSNGDMSSSGLRRRKNGASINATSIASRATPVPATVERSELEATTALGQSVTKASSCPPTLPQCSTNTVLAEAEIHPSEVDSRHSGSSSTTMPKIGMGSDIVTEDTSRSVTDFHNGNGANYSELPPIEREPMTEEEEYWYQYVQGGIRTDGYQPPHRPPSTDESGSEAMESFPDNRSSRTSLTAPQGTQSPPNSSQTATELAHEGLQRGDAAIELPSDEDSSIV